MTDGKARRNAAGLLGAAVVSAVLLLGVAEATAAAPSSGSLDTSRRELFAKMLSDPGNVQLALQYAALSEKDGDLEGAISTLERLQIFAPNLGSLNFELGRLYYQLGAFDLAADYFKTASAAPDATPQMKAAAAAYLSGSVAQTATDHSIGSLMIGARYQTNANGGASSPWVNLNGVEFLLNSAAMGDPDADGFATATLHLTHDLATQGDRFDVDINLYGSLYENHNELDTGAGEIHFGPVFDLRRFSIPQTTLGIYGILDGVTLKGDPYLYTLGVGGVVATTIDPRTVAHARMEYRQEKFLNSDLRPTVSDMSGSRSRLTGDVRRQITDAVALYGAVYGERKNALTGDNADWEAGVSLGTTVSFSGPPVISWAKPWSLDLSIGGLQRDFDAADPTISTSPRLDRELFAQAALTVPVSRDWSAVGTVGYEKVLSSYDLYTYDNLSTSLAMMKNF